MSDYISESTIDRPPREEKEKPKQNNLFNDQDHEENVALLLYTAMPEKFEFKLTLVLKATGDGENQNPTTLPIASGSCPSDRIEEILSKHFESDYFIQRLRAIVGMPYKPKQTEMKLNQQDIPGGEDCKPFNRQVGEILQADGLAPEPQIEVLGIEYSLDGDESELVESEENSDVASEAEADVVSDETQEQSFVDEGELI